MSDSEIDYQARNIFFEDGTYTRYLGDKLVECSKNGDIFIIIPESYLRTALSDEQITLVNEFYNLNVQSGVILDDIINNKTIKNGEVAFKTGIYNKLSDGMYRNYKTTDVEFNFYSVLIADDLSNISVANPFSDDE